MSFRPELSAIGILSGLPLTGATETSVYFSFLQDKIDQNTNFAKFPNVFFVCAEFFFSTNHLKKVDHFWDPSFLEHPNKRLARLVLSGLYKFSAFIYLEPHCQLKDWIHLDHLAILQCLPEFDSSPEYLKGKI